jgi:excisionase family DNA binding protein
MSEDAPSPTAGPRQPSGLRKTGARGARADEAYSGRGNAAGAPLSDVRFLTVAEVALIMRMSKMAIYRLVHTGELESIRVGRSFRVPEQAVNQYLRAAFVEKA